MSCFASQPAWRSISLILWQSSGKCSQRAASGSRRDAYKGRVYRGTRYFYYDRRQKAVIGSHHFIFEDEKCTIPEGMEDRFENLLEEYSHLYLAIQNELAAADLH